MAHAGRPRADGNVVDDVVAVLAREQRALERLLFRLHHARGVLADDDERFLSIAADELEDAAHAVRELEASRSAVLRANGSSLRDLADDSPEPYCSLLQEHRAELGRLAGEVGAMIETTQALATDRLSELPGRASCDDLDRAAAAASYRSVLAASDSLRLPALVNFLR